MKLHGQYLQKSSGMRTRDPNAKSGRCRKQVYYPMYIIFDRSSVNNKGLPGK